MKNHSKNQTCLLISTVFFWFAQYVYIPYQTPYLTTLHLSSRFIGIIIGAYGVSQMLLRLPVGVWADLGGTHKRQIVLGCFFSGTASLFRIVFRSGAGFLAANLFSGFASAMWISFMVLYMSYYAQDRQQTATSHLILCNNLGILLGFSFSTLLYSFVGMSGICLMSVVSGLVALASALMIQEPHSQRAAVEVRELLQICGNRRLLVLSCLALVQQGVQMATTMSFTTQIIRDLGASSAVVGLSSIIYMVSAVCCSRFSATERCTKYGPILWIPAVFLTTAAYCVLVPRTSSVLCLSILQILPGLSTGILYTYLTAEATGSIPSSQKSTAMGFYQAVYALGMTLFPALCGQIAEAHSMRSAYDFLACLCACSAAAGLLYYIGKRSRGR